MNTRTTHRLILLLPAVALLLGIGLAAAIVSRLLVEGLGAAPPPAVLFASAILWLACVAPLLWTASRHARRLAYPEAPLDVGLREVWRIATERGIPPSISARPVSDLSHRRAVRSAVLQAIFVGLLIAYPFLLLPPLRSPGAALWGAVFMALVLGASYNFRLARDFLRRDTGAPIRWRHQYFDERRYEPSGVPFIRRARLLGRIALAWMALGCLLFMRLFAA